MLAIRVDDKGDLEVRWPAKDEQVIALGEAYIARETSLSADQRLSEPELGQVQTALDNTKEAVGMAGSGEVERATAAEAYRQAMEEARPLLELALLRLKSQYAANLAQLEAWGLQTKSGARGVTVLKPDHTKGWAAFLLAYVEREQNLPAEARIADPSLDQMAALAEAVRQNQEQRLNGRTQREIGVKTRSEAVQQLLDLLQLAAVVLVVTRYNRRVMNDLQQWGYEVTARTASRPAEPPPAVA